ncbi:MAG: hypothetical protein E7070_09690 [Bacteroidales bacterium]|nr:hypothetical protein [Bacteroidales bacterium]
MQLSPEIRAFLRQHADDDTARLVLSASHFPDIDIRWAAEQIEARRQLRNKLPEWAANDALLMGGRVPAEQCSSQQTALYKRSLTVGDTLADLTGGMGVDCYYMSRAMHHAIYFERQKHLCEAARNNFEALGADNIEVREGDSLQLGIPSADTIYLDPARRATDGSRVYDLADCEPNVVTLHEELLHHCKRLIIKISPMADVARVMQQMPGIAEIHVVAVRNECKELLLVFDGQCDTANTSDTAETNPTIHCIDFRTADEARFDFKWRDEEASAANLLPADANATFLYEPDVTLLKAGAFRLPCAQFGVWKADTNSHIYLSDTLREFFPGRIFHIEEMIDFSSRNIKRIGKTWPKANIATRNFPLSADELRKRSGIRDGGDEYLFGTTLNGIGHKLIRCHKILTIIILCLILPTILIGRNKKKRTPEVTVESLLQDIQPTAPCQWLQGSEFLYLDDALNATMQPQMPDLAYDTACFRNTIWTFDGILSEEDWMGQQRMMLQFRSPQGRLYRYATGRLMKQMTDTTYRPAIPSMCALAPIRQCDQRLRGRDLFLLINDDRLLVADSIRLEKFVSVRIDSVTVGTELAPLRIWFSHPQGISASIMTSLPNSRENATSTPVQRCFSVADPYRQYPDITADVWALIRANQVRADMTLEEVRLSLGRPQRYEHVNTKGGMIERWHYADRRLLEFIDGRLRRVAIER